MHLNFKFVRNLIYVRAISKFHGCTYINYKIKLDNKVVEKLKGEIVHIF